LKNKPPLIILGMHRSGTSCLAGTLEEAGVHLGEVFRWNPHNLKGNRENKEIMDLHDSILSHNGGSWSDPPRAQVLSWTPEHEAKRDAIIADYRRFAWWRFNNAYWGFKDPRTLLVLEGWLAALPKITAVGIFRNPTSVVRSLQRRDSRLTDELGLDLWLRYNRKLLQYQDQLGFPLVCFDESEEVLREKFIWIIRDLGIPKTHLEFFDPGLRSPERHPLALGEEAGGVHEELRARAI
jgi:hypothetical protein